MIKGKIKSKKAFGIAEVLIASVIIALIIFTLTAAGKSALRSAQYMHERAQAAFLAQEGIEQVRQVRDTNWLDTSASTSFDDLIILAVNSAQERVTAFDAANTKYTIVNQSGSNDQITVDNVIFNRTITFAPVPKDEPSGLLPTDLSDSKGTSVQSDITAVKVNVSVKWTNNTVAKEISVSEIMTNWRPNY